MALEPFTGAVEVRGVLGVTEDELPDANLALPIYEMNLRMVLDEIGTPDNDGALVTAFETILAIAEADRTRPQTNLHAAVTLFAPLVVAVHLASSVPLFTQRTVTDGKAALSRHAESPFAQVISQAKQDYERFRQSLEKRWAAYQSTTVVEQSPGTLFAVSSPTTDIVTNA